MKYVKLFVLFIVLTVRTSSFSFSQEKEHIPVFLAADDYYAPFVATTMASILKNTNSFVDFYILSDGISAENKLKISNEKKWFKNFSIKFIDLNSNELAMMMQKKNEQKEYISKTAYSRIFIPELYVSKNLKKAIYLDVDIILKKDIKLLYDENLDGNIVGVVNDYCVDNPIIKNKKRLKNFKTFNISNDRYFNSGMLLIDVKKWREYDVTGKSMHTAARIMNMSNMHHDQSVLNIVLNGKAKMLPCKYNTSLHNFSDEKNVNSKIDVKSLSKVFNNAVVIHYSSLRHKPWLDKDCLFAKEFWKVAPYTDFEEELENRHDIHLSIQKTRERSKFDKRIIRQFNCTLISGISLLLMNIVVLVFVTRKRKSF